MWRIKCFTLLLALSLNAFTQDKPTYAKKVYFSPEGKLYINIDLPVYLWLSTSSDKSAEKHRLISEQSSKYSNPMYFDVEGFNSVRSPSAVDTSTRKVILPLKDIIFEVYADGTAPVTQIDYGNTVVNNLQGKINIGSGASINLKASDALSGVEAVYFSIDNSAYAVFKDAITLSVEKEYSLKYYAVDHVGNVEKVHELLLVYDKSVPITKLEIEGDKHEDILSGRSKIILKTEDAGTGIKNIFHSLDSGTLKVYTSPILAANISQGDHTLIYYATDIVGNKEQDKVYNFYVDKTPPTIIEEIIGNSFFASGREFSSGKTKLKLTSFDNKAGVKEVRYSVNGKEFELYDKPVLLAQSSGVLDIKSYAVDNVNNKSNSQAANEKTSIPYIDLTGPQLSNSFNGPIFNTRDTVFINSKTKISLKGTDQEAGMNRIEYLINGSDPKEYSEMFVVDNEGFNTIDFTGYDNVENTSLKTFGFKIDNTGPEISSIFGTTPIGKQESIDVYPAHVVLFISATDKTVGYQKMTYSLNGSPAKEYTGIIKSLPKGENTVYVTAYDQLENKSEKEIKFIVQ
jgi:hypothetical protein